MGGNQTKLSMDPTILAQVEEYRRNNTNLVQQIQLIMTNMHSKQITSFPELAIKDTSLAAQFVEIVKKVPPMKMQDKVNIGLFGMISSGKSTMLNSFLGKTVAATGAGGTTKSFAFYSGSGFTLWDIPGRNDGIHYMSATYTAFLKSLTKRVVLITATIQEVIFIFKLLDALNLKYVIVVNKIDRIDGKDELDAFKTKIDEEIKKEDLSGVEKVFFVSGRYPDRQSEWKLLVRYLLGESAPIFYPVKEEMIDRRASSSSSSSVLYNTGSFTSKSSLSLLQKYVTRKKEKVASGPLSAAAFIDIWRRFDDSGNGFINGDDVERFLGEVATTTDQTLESLITQTSMLQELLDRCADEPEIKVGLEEFAGLLPVDEKFLLLFRKNNPLSSSVDFIRIWKKFDNDQSGYIEASELNEFVRQMMNSKQDDSEDSSQQITDEQLTEYSALILRVFDSNMDGKLQLSEMTKLMPVKANGLLRNICKRRSFTARDIDRFFGSYDQDKDGVLKEEEYDGFVYDLLAMSEKDIDFDKLEDLKQMLANNFAVNNEQMTKTELREIMTALCETDDTIDED